jgi:osmotically-inducible protein OsmY
MSIAPLNAATISCDEEALAFDVELALRATGYLALRNLAVVVRDGEVVICGRVPNYYMIQMANTTAKCVAGIRQVRLDLDVVCVSQPSHRRESMPSKPSR